VNVIIVTQDAPMYLPAFLDDFLARLDGTRHTVRHVIVFPPYGKGGPLSELRARLEHYGPLAFAIMAGHVAAGKLLALLYNVFPAVGCHSVGNVIRKYGLEPYRTPSVNAPQFVEYVRDSHIDLIISIASPQIFKEPVLAAPRKGCINYHSALLPRYRGRQPLFWALLNGEREVGVTVHEMDTQLDNGPILIQERVPVEARDSLHALYLKTTRVGPRLLAEAVEMLERGVPDRIENDAGRATIFSFPTGEDSQRFRRLGRRFF
jgi:methionyl-tRNA formyltransferase